MSSKLHTDNATAARALRIAITGGIGSGKTYVCRKIAAAGFPVFYCDDEAKRIIRTLPAVRQALTSLISGGVYDAEGRLVKSVLAAYICGSPAQAAQVNAIVHPRVAEAFRQWVAQQTAALVFMECALLFESGFDALVDVTAHVSVPEALRLRRVMERDHVTAEKAQEWMSLQMPEAEKAARADFVLRNDSETHFAADLQRLLTLRPSSGRATTQG